MLAQATRDLKKLSMYLAEREVVPLSVTRIQLRHDADLDKANRRNPRFLCAVHPHEWLIRCALAIERVNPEVRVGVLLHEIGHMVLPAFNGAKSEVEVDEFVISQVPEAGYYYGDHGYYSPQHEKDVIAKNVEHVSINFLRLVGVD